MTKIALVTGGSGYFGSVIVRHLFKDGWKVRIFDIIEADDRPRDTGFIRGDIRDYDSVLKACNGVDVVHHNVAQVPLAKDKKLFESVNKDGTKNILQASLESKVKKLIYTSSSAVFGIPSKNPVDETVEPRPMEAYGAAKLDGENLCREYVGQGLDVSIIRPRTIIGPGRLGIFYIFFDWILEGKPVYVLGKGDNLYQFVHEDDLADACLKAAEKKGYGEYNIGAKEFNTMRATIQGVIDHAGTKSMIRGLPFGLTIAMMKLTSVLGLSPLGAYHSLMYGRAMYFDLSNAEKELGYKPKWGNIPMFCEAYDWFVQNREAIKKQKEGSHHRSLLKEGALKVLKWLP
jgi:nucleoside-diphosphate-sugar epimerase